MRLPDSKYAVIYADPPWDYTSNALSSEASDHYPTMQIDEIKKLPVDSIAADNCLLFMWTSSPHLEAAIGIGTAWNFKFVTVGFVWVKDRVNPGNYTMSQCELCLIFKRGKIPQPRGIRNARQLVEAPRGRHSAKPAEVRDRITAMFPAQPKIELFARESADGWDSWGNEVSD